MAVLSVNLLADQIPGSFQIAEGATYLVPAAPSVLCEPADAECPVWRIGKHHAEKALRLQIQLCIAQHFVRQNGKSTMPPNFNFRFAQKITFSLLRNFSKCDTIIMPFELPCNSTIRMAVPAAVRILFARFRPIKPVDQAHDRSSRGEHAGKRRDVG